jgi:hypothetical protein
MRVSEMASQNLGGEAQTRLVEAQQEYQVAREQFEESIKKATEAIEAIKAAGAAGKSSPAKGKWLNRIFGR